MASAKGLHLTLVVNYVFNAFLSFTTIVLNILTIQALRKTPSLPKTLKTLLLSLAVSDLVVGLLVQLLYVAILVMNIQQNTESIAYVTVYKAFLTQKKNIGLSFAFWCYFINCWQNLGNPSSTQIPGACDSQACCCQLCSTLDSSFMPPIIVVVCVISTGLLHCKVYAAVRHHTDTSSTEWRYGKRCKGQKIYTCYILRVRGVFSLLFPQCQCLVLFLPRPKVKWLCFLILWYFTLTRLVYRHNTYKIADKSASILTNQILHPFKQSAKAIPMIKHVLKMIETTMRWNRIWKALRFLQITAEHQDCQVIIVFLTIKSPSQNDQNISLTHSQILLKLNGHRS